MNYRPLDERGGPGCTRMCVCVCVRVKQTLRQATLELAKINLIKKAIRQPVCMAGGHTMAALAVVGNLRHLRVTD